MRRTHQRNLHIGAAACLAAVAVLVVAVSAHAQTTSNSAPGKAATATAQPVQQAQPHKGDDGCGPKPTSITTASVSVVDRNGRTVKAKGNLPQPLQPAAQGALPAWACEAKIATLEPVWAGKQLVATWIVKNQGEGDLTIRLKGG